MRFYLDHAHLVSDLAHEFSSQCAAAIRHLRSQSAHRWSLNFCISRQTLPTPKPLGESHSLAFV